MTCGYCPNKDMERKREFMSMEVWQTIIDRYVVPYKEYQSLAYPAHNNTCKATIIPHKDGEPLLGKKHIDMLRYASEKCPDINIDTYSHGLMLPKWKDRGQDFIEFLGTLPNRCRYLMSFHPYNHDGSINDYTETIRYLRNVLKNPPKNVEFITVSHKSKYVSDYIQDNWRSEWAGLPITVHCNASLNPWTGRIEEEGTVAFNGCPYGDFGHMFFGVTGNVIACCLDLEEEIVFGNVMVDEPARMIEKLESFYADQRAKVVTHSVCNNCHGLPQSAERLLSLGVKS